MFFFIPQMVNYPILYAAIMTLWLVALPGSPFIYCVSRICNVMSVDVPAAACLRILGSLGAIIIAQWPRSPDYKM